MKVKVSRSAQIVMRNLSSDDRLRVQTWIDYLERWETDSFIQGQAVELEEMENTYMLVTNTEFRVFFSIEGDEITIRDIATINTILKSGVGQS